MLTVLRGRPEGSPARTNPRIARCLRSFLLAVGIVVVAVGVGQMLHGATLTGYSVDESTHVERLRNWHDHGWYLRDRELDSDDLPLELLADRSVYGPAFALLAHSANVTLGNETYGEVATTAAANDVRHLTVAFLGGLTVVAVGLIAWLMSGSLLAAVWASAALSSVPVWVGHAMFNIKDVPTAAGYTLASLSLAMATVSASTERDGWAQAALAATVMAAGVAVGVGTRTGSWILIFVSIIAYYVVRRLQMGRTDRWLLSPSDIGILGGGLVGLAAVLTLYPNNAARPLTWFVDAVRVSADYPWVGPTLTAGRLLDENPAWWYLPIWVGASVPVIVTAVAVTGLGATAYVLVRMFHQSVDGRLRSVASDPRITIVFVLLQLLLGPLAAIVFGSALYTGLRQQLFIVPPIAVLAGLGVATLIAWLGNQRRWGALLGAAGLGIGLLLPTTDQIRLHPYQYVYLNEFASPINGRWETDYWFVGAREAIRRIPADARAQCSGWLLHPWHPDRDPYRFSDCRGSIGPYLSEQGAEAIDADLADDEAWVIGRARAGNRPPDGCREVENVTRPLHDEQVVITYLLACPREPAA